MPQKKLLFILLVAAMCNSIAIAENETSQKSESLSVEIFLDLQSPDAKVARTALAKIRQDWRDDYTPMIVESMRALRGRGLSREVLATLQEKTGQSFGIGQNDWYQWMWKQDFEVFPEYSHFKSKVYRQIDRRFQEYFDDNPESTIDMREIRWGGVRRDGIPPLKNPEMYEASEASYLEDTNVVFGIEVNGDARAYPKRFLAWHEMFKDIVGGESVNGVYCTLCGTVILYRTVVNGQHHELGTSGFLYRSNKLMYDHATKSMWSTIKGEPVVGPLVGKGIKLESLSVVTTTWGKWRQQHPDSKVLSPRTGFSRDYGEGVAYKKYFATDKLMFTVPSLDARLPNKAEVLVVRTEQTAEAPIAISANYLRKHPVFQTSIAQRRIVVVTDKLGANRVYDAANHNFKPGKSDVSIVDSDQKPWSVTEQALESDDGKKLKRLPSHRIFWFAWFNAHPNTRLIK